MPNGRQGFTLIELLVVIAIIGILSSVVLASLNSARKKARDARRVSDIKQVQLALELEFDKTAQYPAGGFNAMNTTLKTSLFLPADVKDPLNTVNNVYKYCKISDTDYHLAATLEEAGAATNSDSDVDTTCSSGESITGIGTPDLVYDVKP